MNCGISYLLTIASFNPVSSPVFPVQRAAILSMHSSWNETSIGGSVAYARQNQTQALATVHGGASHTLGPWNDLECHRAHERHPHPWIGPARGRRRRGALEA